MTEHLPPIGVLVVTHGLFGHELVKTAEEMVGHSESVVALSVTSQSDRDALGRSIEESMTLLAPIKEFLILVDLLGGTPCNVALLKSTHTSTEIISGVNLYMLLSALRNRSSLPLPELAQKVAEDGKKAILLPKALLAQRRGADGH